MDLHELSRKGCQAWRGKVIQEGNTKGEEALFPMLLKLGEDIFDMVLIDQVIALHDGFRGGAAVYGMK